MIEIKENGKVDARILHEFLESKQKFANWITNYIRDFGFIENKDFLIILLKSTGGRPIKNYDLTIDMSKELSMLARNDKGKQARLYFITEQKKRQELEYITPKEAALAYEYINFFKYVENQKDAYLQHRKYYVDSMPKSKYIYAEYAKYRANIVGWDKQKIDEAIKKYLTTHAGHNFTKLMRKSMSDKLSVIDVNEAIKVSVLDLLYSNGTDTELAKKFANMVKNVSNEMDVLVYKKNETNLFQQKETLNLKAIT